jgi:hypothetical protein
MSGTIPPLPNTPSWCGAHLKHRDNFTSLYLYIGVTFLTVREDLGLRVFENRVLRVIVLRGRKWQEAGEDCIMGNFIMRTLPNVF